MKIAHQQISIKIASCRTARKIVHKTLFFSERLKNKPINSEGGIAQQIIRR
jgi:hypothetical protein